MRVRGTRLYSIDGTAVFSSEFPVDESVMSGTVHGSEKAHKAQHLVKDSTIDFVPLYMVDPT